MPWSLSHVSCGQVRETTSVSHAVAVPVGSSDAAYDDCMEALPACRSIPLSSNVSRMCPSPRKPLQSSARLVRKGRQRQDRQDSPNDVPRRRGRRCVLARVIHMKGHIGTLWDVRCPPHHSLILSAGRVRELDERLVLCGRVCIISSAPGRRLRDLSILTADAVRRFASAKDHKGGFPSSEGVVAECACDCHEGSCRSCQRLDHRARSSEAFSRAADSSGTSSAQSHSTVSSSLTSSTAVGGASVGAGAARTCFKAQVKPRIRRSTSDILDMVCRESAGGTTSGFLT